MSKNEKYIMKISQKNVTIIVILLVLILPTLVIIHRLHLKDINKVSKDIYSTDITGIDGNIKPGNYDFTFTTKDGRERTYILHVPEANSIHLSDPNEKIPLVIVLHGTYGSGSGIQSKNGFDPYADEHGFLVAYPDAYTEPGERQNARWNDGRETLEATKLGIDDIAFIRELIDNINDKITVNREKVFATGPSNGGIMTYRLGCEASDLFAGIAPVIANIATSESPDGTSVYDRCAPTDSIQVLAINGDADPVVPIQGGEVCKDIRAAFCEKGFVASREDSLMKFSQTRGCSIQVDSEDLPILEDDGTSVERQTYTCGAQASTVGVTSYIVHGGGHAWPPLKPELPALGLQTHNLDATKTIVEFFVGILNEKE